jgi:hypothetical protein
MNFKMKKLKFLKNLVDEATKTPPRKNKKKTRKDELGLNKAKAHEKFFPILLEKKERMT